MQRFLLYLAIRNRRFFYILSVKLSPDAGHQDCTVKPIHPDYLEVILRRCGAGSDLNWILVDDEHAVHQLEQWRREVIE